MLEQQCRWWDMCDHIVAVYKTIVFSFNRININSEAEIWNLKVENEDKVRGVNIIPKK